MHSLWLDIFFLKNFLYSCDVTSKSRYNWGKKYKLWANTVFLNLMVTTLHLNSPFFCLSWTPIRLFPQMSTLWGLLLRKGKAHSIISLQTKVKDRILFWIRKNQCSDVAFHHYKSSVIFKWQALCLLWSCSFLNVCGLNLDLFTWVSFLNTDLSGSKTPLISCSTFMQASS